MLQGYIRDDYATLMAHRYTRIDSLVMFTHESQILHTFPQLCVLVRQVLTTLANDEAVEHQKFSMGIL